MPIASLVHDHLVAMLARGWAEFDWSTLGLLAAVEAGLIDGRRTAAQSHACASVRATIARRDSACRPCAQEWAGMMPSFFA
jgi:hypothetical protein